MGKPKPPASRRGGRDEAAPAAPRRRWPHALLVTGLLILCGLLAVTSLLRDSITFDEPAHLAAGLSYLKTGDFRLSPEHPPLSKLWVAWPLLFIANQWPSVDSEAWQKVDLFGVALQWLFQLNDGHHLVVVGRCMMVILLLATCLTVYFLARSVWGPGAGLLALTVAVLSPELLAHGRLVTTDLPITLCCAVTLLTFARLVQRLSWPRLIAAALALTATSLTKFSWPLVVPAVVAMAVVAIVRRQPIEIAASRHAGESGAEAVATRNLTRRRDRMLAALGATVFVALVMWVGIWTCYGWRRAMLEVPASSAPATQPSLPEQKVFQLWQNGMHWPDGKPRQGLLPAFLLAAQDHGWLPDSYLVGLAMTMQYAAPRKSYLLGECSDRGWLSYFPIAFVIKTPLATIGLLLAGLTALVLGRTRSRDPVLLTGLAVFAAVYVGCLINSRLNIGQRHLLPVYPVVYVFAGATAAWLSARMGRGVVVLALVWLLGANLWMRGQYLSYFNELIGGPARGYRWLADSNVDWGQDLLRLREYALQHRAESIKLAYFGSAIPTYYYPSCQSLPSYFDFAPRADLAGGTYVVSVTQLLGVYDPELRDSFWTPKREQAYADLGEIAGSSAVAGESETTQQRRIQAAKEYGELRYKRLLNRLAHRPPDMNIGYSLFLYRLKDADVQELTRP